MKTEDTDVFGRQRAKQARSKPDTVDQPVRTVGVGFGGAILRSPRWGEVGKGAALSSVIFFFTFCLEVACSAARCMPERKSLRPHACVIAKNSALLPVRSYHGWHGRTN